MTPSLPTQEVVGHELKLLVTSAIVGGGNMLELRYTAES